MQTVRLLAFLLAALGAAVPGSAQAVSSGVVVESLGELGAGTRGGLVQGDVLQSWRRAASPPANPEPAVGTFLSVFDVFEADIEQAPRGPVTLELLREGQPLTIELPPGGWVIDVRPPLDGSDLEEYLRGRQAFDDGEVDLGAERWAALGARLAASDRPEWSIELAFLRARAALEARRLELAQEAADEGLGGARHLDRIPWVAMLKTLEARIHSTRNDFTAAAASAAEALAQWRQEPTPSLAEASVLHLMSEYRYYLGEYERAQELLEQTLTLRQALAPDSVEVASALVGFAYLLDTAEARAPVERALEIARRHLPESLLTANILNALANIARAEGDLARSEALCRQTLEMRRRLEPDGMGVGYSYYGLANVLWRRGRLVEAEELFRRALEVYARHQPGGQNQAGALLALGVVNAERGDSETALAYYEQSYELSEKLAPRSPTLAALSVNIGTEARVQGKLTVARQHYLDAQTMRRELGIEDLDSVSVLNQLAEVALESGDLDEAETRCSEALRLARRLGPSSLSEASALENLARLAMERGERAQGERHLMQALAITEQIAPFREATANILARLADLHREAGERDQALEFSRRAIAALEGQMTSLGGGQEVRASFSARYGSLYRSYLHLLVEAGRPGEAFHVSERFRARLFRSMLAERDLVFAADLPAGLDRDRRLLNAEYDREYSKLVTASAKSDAEAVAEMQTRLEELRLRRRDIENQVRSASPRLAALGAPAPLGLAASRQALEPGTLLLSYIIDDHSSYLFAVGPGEEDFRVVAVAANREQLRAEVDRFRTTMARGPTRLRGRLDRLADHLSEVLLDPVAEPLSRADRVVVLADGPLHFLPFAALPAPDDAPQRRPLVEALPISFAPSATVLAEVGSRRPAGQVQRLAAFGDPMYPTVERTAIASAALLDMTRRGFDLRPLPATRVEVESLRGLFGDDAAVWLGPEATEERAKALDRKVDFVHFACHAFVDERSPLDSGLVLTLPADAGDADDNGLLQAWEIFERVRLDADLVTLSACETALGKESGGEGILGLTRAFQFAGARTVVASMWGVSDASTAALMSRFYGYLKQGKGKAEALRNAQLDLLKGPVELESGGKTVVVDAAHPFYWAAFQLYGDWR